MFCISYLLPLCVLLAWFPLLGLQQEIFKTVVLWLVLWACQHKHWRSVSCKERSQLFKCHSVLLRREHMWASRGTSEQHQGLRKYRNDCINYQSGNSNITLMSMVLSQGGRDAGRRCFEARSASFYSAPPPHLIINDSCFICIVSYIPYSATFLVIFFQVFVQMDTLCSIHLHL